MLKWAWHHAAGANFDVTPLSTHRLNIPVHICSSFLTSRRVVYKTISLNLTLSFLHTPYFMKGLSKKKQRNNSHVDCCSCSIFTQLIFAEKKRFATTVEICNKQWIIVKCPISKITRQNKTKDLCQFTIQLQRI